MSQDKFWEQWGPGGAGNTPAEGADTGPGGGDKPVDDDVLAVWLKTLPPDDPLVPTRPPAPAAPAPELPAIWPPPAPVDPFSGMQQSSGVPASSEWDFAIDPAPQATPTPAPPPSTPAFPTPAAPPAGPLGDFAFDLGSLAGPVPAANPFAPPEPGGTASPPASSPPAAAPSLPSPFGPPPPPIPPPAEVLLAPPLKLEIKVGRRTSEMAIQGEALIGRPDVTRGINPEIDLRLDDAVSRRHAKIFIKNGVYVLTDLNSTNGTRHNGQWLQAELEIPLKVGDEIEIGELTTIRVREAPNPDA